VGLVRLGLPEFGHGRCAGERPGESGSPGRIFPRTPDEARFRAGWTCRGAALAGSPGTGRILGVV